MNRLDSHEEVEAALCLLTRLLEARGAWFLRESRDSRAVELRRGDWGLRVAGGGLLLSYWGESGTRAWRVLAWRAEGEGLYLEAVRRSGAGAVLLSLVPRARVASAREAVADARRAECARLAALVCEFARARLEHASLSVGARRGEPGRWARVLLKMRAGAYERVAVAAPVVPVGAEAVESFLTSALLWFTRLSESERGAHALWLVAPRALAAAVCERLPLLHDGLRERVSVYELGEGECGLSPLRVPTLEELLDAPATKLSRAAPRAPCELAARIIALAPDEIDLVRARHGETLRFQGLPFARVRRVAGKEHLWFGVGGRRALFEEGSEPDLLNLLAALKEHRRDAAPERRHALYRAAPEAWLEAMLRRDVTRLDPGLRLAPIHAQFRAAPGSGSAARPVDLLALRRDGRLVVVELKVAEDASLALQGADYWRRVLAHHRAGHIKRARLFGNAEVSEDAPLVYLVAPLLRFHRSFQMLARCIRPEIELYRFDINEDWRAGVHVVRRVTLTNNWQ
ncbi:MAG: hypothetical protein QOH49_4805 [Acidobacteriota bacterium]|jgi:hypothetical protein|nr:hypothetical protein [Acidobacteriota bacterium]